MSPSPQKLIEEAWAGREAYVRKNKLEAFRLLNGAGDGLPGITADYYAGSFHLIVEGPAWLQEKAAVEEYLSELPLPAPASKPSFHWIRNFGGKVALAPKEKLEEKIIREFDLNFKVKLGGGLHTGLFLDQRENRRRLRAIASQLRVLNLFSYTGAFTVAALMGGAREAHSLDLSKNYLNWMRENLELNRLPVERALSYAADVFQFLKQGRRERYELIILDPPTFSRTKERSFSTEKQLGSLVQDAAALLAPQGRLFVSVNTRKLTPREFLDQVKSGIQSFGLKVLESFPPPPDFRLSREDAKNPHLKSCLLG